VNIGHELLPPRRLKPEMRTTGRPKLSGSVTPVLMPDVLGFGAVIVSENLLPEVVEAEAQLVGETGGGHPYPAGAENLCAGLRLGEEEGIDDVGVFFGLQAVAEEIGAEEGVLCRIAVVGFDDCVVFAIEIVVVEIHERARPGI
jgi:hypothetical protein